MPTGLRRLCSDADETVKQYSQHNRRNYNIDMIVLLEKGEQRKCNARDWRRDQKEDSELNQPFWTQVKCTSRDLGHALERIWLSVEFPIISNVATVQEEKQDSSDRGDTCGYNHSPAEQIANEQLNMFITPASRSPQWVAQMPPRNPLYAISIARKTITAVNIARSAGTFAPDSTRAPVSAPARTPSITGKTMAGSM